MLNKEVSAPTPTSPPLNRKKPLLSGFLGPTWKRSMATFCESYTHQVLVTKRWNWAGQRLWRKDQMEQHWTSPVQVNIFGTFTRSSLVNVAVSLVSSLALDLNLCSCTWGKEYNGRKCSVLMFSVFMLSCTWGEEYNGCCESSSKCSEGQPSFLFLAQAMIRIKRYKKTKQRTFQKALKAIQPSSCFLKPCVRNRYISR